MKITLRKIQIYPRLSQETTAFNADIYVDDVKAGTASNYGQGGCNLYDWENRSFGNKVEQFAKAIHPEDLEPLSHIIDDIIAEFEEEKQLRRWCKTKTVIRLKGDEEGVYRTHKSVYVPHLHRDIIKAKNPNLEEIINDRFL
jgi:hypothetical protein